MKLNDPVLSALTDMGFTAPLEVQRLTFEPAMAGRDLLVQARTGSGKTAAFGIPFAQGLVKADKKGVQAIALCPTRELALQVANELARILARLDIGVVAVYGGAPMGRQIEALKAGASIVVGTPGRVLDHIRRGTLKLKDCTIAVLDECDEMLSMGFLEDIEKILSELPPPGTRQTLLFSATIPPDIDRISQRYMRDAQRIKPSEKGLAPPQITHAYYMVSGASRNKDLLRVLDLEKPESAIIFCNTRDETASVAGFLQRHGHDAEHISSDLSQADRERVMKRSKDKTLKYLVATDIAARGIDISDLTHVFNYTFPESAEIYIHRTGRTGRAGKAGAAISLIGPRELGNFYYLKLITKVKPEERTLPTDDELSTRREADRYQKLLGSVADDAGEEWRALARRLATSSDAERVVAGLIKRELQGRSGDSDEPGPGASAKVTTLGGGFGPQRVTVRDDGPGAGGVGGGAGGQGGGSGGGAGGRVGARKEAPAMDLGVRMPRKVKVVDLASAQALVQGAPAAGAGENTGAGAPREDRPRRDREDRPRRDREDRPRRERSQPREAVAAAAPVGDAAVPAVASEAAGALPDAVAAGGEAVASAGATAPAGAPGEQRERTSRRRRSDFNDRPAERGGDRGGFGGRDRGGRDRGRGGPGRERDRGPRTGGPGDAGAGAAAGAAERARRQPEQVAPLERPPGDAREFWEAWVDEKTTVREPAPLSEAPRLEGDVESFDEGSKTSSYEPLPPAAPNPRDAGLVRLYLNLGKRDGASQAEVEELILARTGLAELDLSRLDVQGTHTYIHVRPELEASIVAALTGHMHGTRALVCERARK
ncbi:MAG: DEAD/DEAH box helicase [Deltaproteobacteria bacterium]|nr:DEAD/DEAH box helicase [Deltaproteobacteria bacterium]